MSLKTQLYMVKTRLASHKKLCLAIVMALLLLLIIAFNAIGALLDRGIRVIAMEPSGEINVRTNLTFSFSGDIVTAKGVGRTFRGDIIRFRPGIPGRFRYISRRELQFLPEVPFRPSTKYTAQLQQDVVKIKDRNLTGQLQFEFATQQFRVTNVAVSFDYPGDQKKGLQMAARINFNYPVDPRELQKALKISFGGEEGQKISYNLNSDDPNASFTVTSEMLFPDQKERQIVMALPAGFRCLGGEIGLPEDYRTSAVLGARQELTIREAVPQSDAAQCWIAVHCSEPVAAQNISEFIRMKPKVKFHTEVEGDTILIKSNRFRPGENYNLFLKAGLPSLNGLPLTRDFAAGVFFGDLEPSLKFNSPGRYLSSKGHLNLGLETVNVAKVNVEISRIFPNNIVTYLNNDYNDSYYEEGYDDRPINKVGKVLKSEVITVGGAKNGLVTTPISLSDYLSGGMRGFFQIVAYDEDERWRQDSKYVIVTDLGLVAKLGQNELMVWVNSLETLEPKAKVKVSLISRNNQTLATAATDSQGLVRFPGIKKETAGFESFVILAELDNDFAFMHLPSSLISTADFEVRGRRHLEDGYEAYLYLDRDLFRPGDQANLAALVRGAGGIMAPELPVKLEIRQPDGQLFKELQSNTRDRGACEFPVAIPDYAETGRYTANLYVAEAIIGSCSFSVEEFMPERIKVTTRTDKDEYSVGETAAIKVEGLNLYGPPAAGRRTELQLRLETAVFDPPGFHSYAFGDPEQKFEAKEEQLGEAKLDAKGTVSYSYAFPEGMTPPGTLRATFQATVHEEGGRAVSSYRTVRLHPYASYIGIKPLGENYGAINQPYQFKYVVLDRQGKPVPKPQIRMEVFKINWNSIYRKNDNGQFEYTSVEEREKVKGMALSGTAGENGAQYVPREYGEYLIVLSDPGSKSRSVLKFYASGWGYSPWAMADPDKVQLDLDQKVYRPGNQARLQIKAPFAGKALITVEREKVYDYKIVDLPQNSGVIELPVKEAYKPNVYVSVHLIRAVKSLDKKAPSRAFGVIPLMVDCSEHQLRIELDSPAEVRPNRPSEINVKVDRASAQAYLTLAAVDEGICQLSNYGAPNPADFFYGKRSLNIDSYDLYGMILPEVESVKTRQAPGGDGELENARRQNLNPVAVQRVKPVSLWSGLVKLDREGRARIRFDVPQFNGSLRLMAVVGDGSSFGSAQKKLIVRDPIVMTPSFPRFIAPRDRFAVPVTLFNGTGKSGNFRLVLKTEGPVELLSEATQAVKLNNRGEQVVYYQLRAKNALGKLAFRFSAQGNGTLCEYREELSLRPAVPLINQMATGTIQAAKPFQFEAKGQWVPGTAKYTLTLAPFPSLKFAGSLQYLLGYPYGCVEQTTSKVFPLIYFNDLARATHHEVFKGGNADYYIGQGIEKLQTMQLHNGSFAYWPGGDYCNEWGSIYAAHFLVEARKAGYTVSDRVYNKMLNYLQVTARSGQCSGERLETRIYALYVLSLAGRPQTGTMSYLKNVALGEMNEMSRAQLAAAYFYSGERKTAHSLLPVTFAAGTGKPSSERQSGGNFDSPLRSDAIILSALADVDPTHGAVYKLVSRITKAAAPGRWGTTQENAFALMALGKLLAKKSEGTYQGEVFVAGVKIAAFDHKKEVYLQDRRLGQGAVTVKISGQGQCYYFLQTTGIPDQAGVREADNGMSIRREYFDRNGDRVDLSRVRQGDLVIADLELKLNQGGLENIAVVDLLPAGLEIDNPRLANAANLSWLQKSSLHPDSMDIRDDRLVFFVSPREAGTYHFYYALRAVTCGEFILPSVKAECMYEPDISSYASSGCLTVARE